MVTQARKEGHLICARPTGSSGAMEGTGVVWFKPSDLRLLDHEPMTEAHRENRHVLHVFCFDRRWFGPAITTFESPSLKTGIHRARFLLEAVADLKARLGARGSDLMVLQGLPEQEIPRMARTAGASAVYTHSEVTYEELQVQEGVRTAMRGGGATGAVALKEFWDNHLYHIDDLPFKVMEKMPSVFTQFRKLVETRCPVRPVLPIPEALKKVPDVVISTSAELPTLADFGFAKEDDVTPPPNLTATGEEAYLVYHGGETAGLERVKTYIFDLDLLKEYKDTRNGLLGPNFSSKFSPWLATGSISPRYVLQEIRRYESERVANDSTYWLYFELLWRDFFFYSSLYYGNSIFKLGGPQRKPDKYPWVRDAALFEAWREGRTGYPFIDANMRELKATGFMSNRGRQVVASFLTRDMMIDWRLGAAHFEELLLDYDPCANYGNWTYVAGVGSDPRESRYFSVSKQSSTYDPEGSYMKYWLPELAALPKEFLHHPQRLDEATRRKYHVSEEVYPSPIVPLKYSNFSSSKAKPFGPKRPGHTGHGGVRGGGGVAREGGQRSHGSRADGRASAYSAQRDRKQRVQHEFMMP